MDLAAALDASHQLDRYINDYNSKLEENELNDSRSASTGEVSNGFFTRAKLESPTATVTDENEGVGGQTSKIPSGLVNRQQSNADMRISSSQSINLEDIFGNEDGSLDLEEFGHSKTNAVKLPMPEQIRLSGRESRILYGKTSTQVNKSHEISTNRYNSMPTQVSTPGRMSLRQELRSLQEKIRVDSPSSARVAPKHSASTKPSHPSGQKHQPLSTPPRFLSQSPQRRVGSSSRTEGGPRLTSLSAQPNRRMLPHFSNTNDEEQQFSVSVGHGGRAKVTRVTDHVPDISQVKSQVNRTSETKALEKDLMKHGKSKSDSINGSVTAVKPEVISPLGHHNVSTQDSAATSVEDKGEFRLITNESIPSSSVGASKGLSSSLAQKSDNIQQSQSHYELSQNMTPYGSSESQSNSHIIKAYPRLKPLRSTYDVEVQRVDALLMRSFGKGREAGRLSPLSNIELRDKQKLVRSRFNSGANSDYSMVDVSIRRTLNEDLDSVGLESIVKRGALNYAMNPLRPKAVFSKGQINRVAYCNDPTEGIDLYQVDPRLLVSRNAIRSRVFEDDELLESSDPRNFYELDDVSSDDGLIEEIYESSDDPESDSSSSDNSNNEESYFDLSESVGLSSSHQRLGSKKTENGSIFVNNSLSQERKRPFEIKNIPIAHSKVGDRLLKTLWSANSQSDKIANSNESKVKTAKLKLLEDYVEGLATRGCRIAHVRDAFSPFTSRPVQTDLTLAPEDQHVQSRRLNEANRMSEKKSRNPSKKRERSKVVQSKVRKTHLLNQDDKVKQDLNPNSRSTKSIQTEPVVIIGSSANLEDKSKVGTSLRRQDNTVPSLSAKDTSRLSQIDVSSAVELILQELTQQTDKSNSDLEVWGETSTLQRKNLDRAFESVFPSKKEIGKYGYLGESQNAVKKDTEENLPKQFLPHDMVFEAEELSNDEKRYDVTSKIAAQIMATSQVLKESFKSAHEAGIINSTNQIGLHVHNAEYKFPESRVNEANANRVESKRLPLIPITKTPLSNGRRHSATYNADRLNDSSQSATLQNVDSASAIIEMLMNRHLKGVGLLSDTPGNQLNTLQQDQTFTVGAGNQGSLSVNTDDFITENAESFSRVGTQSRPGSAMSWSSSLRNLIRGKLPEKTHLKEITKNSDKDTPMDQAEVRSLRAFSSAQKDESLNIASSPSVAILPTGEAIFEPATSPFAHLTEGRIPHFFGAPEDFQFGQSGAFKGKVTEGLSDNVHATNTSDIVGIADVLEISSGTHDNRIPYVSTIHPESEMLTTSARPESRLSEASSTSTTNNLARTQSRNSTSSDIQVLEETEKLLDRLKDHVRDFPARVSLESFQQTKIGTVESHQTFASSISSHTSNVSSSMKDSFSKNSGNRVLPNEHVKAPSSSAAIIAAANAAMAAAKVSPFVNRDVEVVENESTKNQQHQQITHHSTISTPSLDPNQKSSTSIQRELLPIFNETPRTKDGEYVISMLSIKNDEPSKRDALESFRASLDSRAVLRNESSFLEQSLELQTQKTFDARHLRSERAETSDYNQLQPQHIGDENRKEVSDSPNTSSLHGELTALAIARAELDYLNAWRGGELDGVDFEPHL